MRVAKIPTMSGEHEQKECYSVMEFPYHEIDHSLKKVQHKKKQLDTYCNAFGAFDIETHTIDCDEPFGYMYIWQCCVDGLGVFGRTWGEFIFFMKKLSQELKVSPRNRIVIYVHNLGYEFQFMHPFLIREFGELTVFAPNARKPLTVRTSNGIEFRCSYILTNMSLAKACENEKGMKYMKAVGDLDYKKRFTPNSILSDQEFGYAMADVFCLYDLIKNRLQNENDNLESIPLTSTGYVRRDCRIAVRKNPRYAIQHQRRRINETVYIMLKEAGRGGNTHANRYMSGRVWRNVDSFDFVSSYIASLLLRKYPISSFFLYATSSNIDTLNELVNEYACLFHITFYGLRLKDEVPIPYIPISKCLNNPYVANDNGRVLYSDDPVMLCLTDIDWEIIKREYIWDSVDITDLYIARYGYLPKELRDVLLDYFRKKQELKFQIKTEEAKEETDEELLADINYLYAKSKNKLNAIFGMAYTDIVHPEYEFNSEGEWELIPPDIEKCIADYYKNRNNFMYYPWGVWCTAWSRLAFEELTEATNSEKTHGVSIYGDTDSSKCINPDFDKINAYNDKIIRECEELGAYVDVNNKRYYVGIIEHETENGAYEEFVTLGAKKYAYTENGKLHITISGVSKKGAEEMESIKDFRPGFIFTKHAGQTLWYNDGLEIKEITIDGCTFETSANIGMLDSTYELGITNEYMKLLGLEDL